MVAPFFFSLSLPELELAVGDREIPTGSFATLQLNADSRGQSVYRCYPSGEWEDEESNARIYTYLRGSVEKKAARWRPSGGTVNINKRAQSPRGR